MRKIILLSIAVLGMTSCQAPKSPDRQKEYDSNLKEAEANMAKSDVQQESSDKLTSKGTIQAEYIIPVSSRVAGQIVRLDVTLGQHVKKGEILVRLDNTECQDRINRSKAEYEQADYRYQAVLMGLGYKRANLDTATPEHKSQAAANSGLTVARTTYEEAQHELAYYTIKAPISGVVSNVQAANYANVMAGEELFQIIDETRLQVCFDVLESELSKYEKGATVNVTTTAYPDEQYEANVIEISPEVKPNGMVTIHASIQYNPHLIPGMTATVLRK